MKKTIVMKFGGASLSTIERVLSAGKIILTRSQNYSRLIVVVSAMGDMTNELFNLAKKVCERPPKREQDMLISVGERISMALLAMALSDQNKDAISFTGSQSGIITSSDHSEATIIDVRPYRLSKALDEGKIVIVAGFQGVSHKGEITTLGRGGSDTSAVALGVALRATKVEFYKDVKGIYSEDPKKNAGAEFFSNLNYNQALDIAREGSQVLHPRSILLASKNQLPLHVLPFEYESERSHGTLIEPSNVSPQEEMIYENSHAH